ncbi:hypothetical protein [Phosphitispora fastidiosa]|uniref:hypothetical protein n=1 Tax=Phosphitispora fastidiosa TaxID=2837202 RepID=UPI001E536F7E|nr:hypothetical protein [Phosphitispora fastidiosa]MBU7008097.1 hypothetical protein [Phosphitispora fastidiosa]
MYGLFWVTLFILLMLAMLILVPRRAVIKLFPVGIIGGFGQAVIIMGFLVSVFEVWQLRYHDFFAFAGIPLFAALAWVPEVIMFSYFMKYLGNDRQVFAYLAGFTMLAGLSVHWLFRAGYLVYNGWNSILTLPVALLAHSTIAYYIVKTSRVLDKRRQHSIE